MAFFSCTLIHTLARLVRVESGKEATPVFQSFCGQLKITTSDRYWAVGRRRTGPPP